MSNSAKEYLDSLNDKSVWVFTKQETDFNIAIQATRLFNNIPNIEDVEPMTHCLDDFVYELREDEVEESIPIEDLLQNCDDYIENEIKVPKVVG